jgi:hypothetical protein
VVFVETSGFTDRRASRLSDEDFRRMQSWLMANPEAGNVIPGCGGLRKMRFADERHRKGKRGGYRVIYLDLPRANRIYLIDIYGKGEKEDLDPDTKKHFRNLAATLKSRVQP